MCDYSLESYRSRAAKNGEELTVRAFPSGSKGFVAAGDSDCAVCCKDGVEMTLDLAPSFYLTQATEFLRDYIEEMGGEIPVTFHTQPRTTSPWGGFHMHHRDGFILPDARFLSLQTLPVGTHATVTKALPREIMEAAKGGVASKDDIETRIADVAPLAPATVD